MSNNTLTDDDLIARRTAVAIADAHLKDVPETVDLESDRNLFAAGYLAAAGSIKAGLRRATPSPSAREAAEHPEDFCEKCGRPNIVWFAPNALWNQAVRAANEPEILCPICFVRLVEAAGMSAVWEVAPQNYHAEKGNTHELS